VKGKNKSISIFQILRFKTTLKAFKELLKSSKCFSFTFIFKILIYFYSSFLLLLGYVNSILIYNALFFALVNATLSSLLIVFSKLSKCKVFFLGALLFVLYLLSFKSASQANLSVPCRPSSIIGVEGTVLNDVSKNKNGNYIIKIKGTKVYLRSNLSLSFKGEIVILSKVNYSLMRSSYIFCDVEYDDEFGFYKGTNIKVFSVPKIFSMNRSKVNYTYQNILWKIRTIRVTYRNWIYRCIKPTLARLLLLGRSDDDGFIFKEAALEVGCSHLLALSGMHLSYISTFFSFIPVFILKKWTDSKKIGKRISIIFPLLFVLIAGALPSLIRALFMYSLGLFMIESEFKKELTFLLSLFLQLLLFHFSIVEIGMLLSYTIIAVLSILNMFIQKTGKIKGALLSTLSALLISYPLGKLFGGSWSIAAVVVAPVATAMISISMLCSLLLFLSILNFNGSIYLSDKYFSEGIIFGFINLNKKLANFLIFFLSSKINELENLLKIVFKKGIRVHLYLPIIFTGAKGYEVYCLTLLTALGVYLYSIAIIRYRRKRIYELELSIRFPKCNHPNP
jgi:predicted membrane metal-binding protein